MVIRMTSSADQIKRVADLRRAGASAEQIAEVLGVTPRKAVQLLDAAAKSRRSEAEFDTALELERLDRLYMAVWTKASRGDPAAIKLALQISERREQLSVPKGSHGTVLAAFDESVKSSTLLQDDMDAALVESGRRIAERIDIATATGAGQEVTKALYLVPHMMNVLREMGATPAARAAMKKTASSGAPTTAETDAEGTDELSQKRANRSWR